MYFEPATLASCLEHLKNKMCLSDMGLILGFQYAVLCTQLAEPLNLLQC